MGSAEDREILYLLKNINDKLRQQADRNLIKYNFTMSQSRVHGFLYRRGGEATQKEIETFLDVSHPTVVGIIARMEKNGHVTTRLDTSDKRNKIVSLTKMSRDIGAEMHKNMEENRARILSSLTKEEQRQLYRILARMLTKINQDMENAEKDCCSGMCEKIDGLIC